jgi:predicted transcriptional regulator
MAEREVMLELAAEIISAHVSNNVVQTDQLPKLIQQVFNSLSNIELIVAACHWLVPRSNEVI